MEDLKKIQEFFSKPLEENSRLRKQFILLETAEIKYTKSFGTGIKAPGVLHLANEGVFFGAEDAYIIVLPGGTFYVDEDKEEAIPIWPLKDQSQELHKALHPTPFAPEFEVWKNWIKRPEVNEAKKLTYNDFVRMVKDDMMAGASPDEMPSDKQVASRAKAYYNDYLQGASVDDLFEATKEEENEFHKELDKLVHKTFGHSSDEKKKMAEYIAETIKLGLMVNEELCEKGKRYIKARQAAGEKSSAYLSGRAVRVCKGQIEWPKKGKKK